MACSSTPSFSPLALLTNPNQNYTFLPPLDTTFQYHISVALRPEYYSPYTHSTQKAPLPSWSPSEPTWINSPQQSYFGRNPSHEPWRSPILQPPLQSAMPTPVKVKESQDKRQQQWQKRSPSNSFSSPSMPKPSIPVEVARRRSEPILPSKPNARSPPVGPKPQLYISPNYDCVQFPQSPSPSSSLSPSPMVSSKQRPNATSPVHRFYGGLQRTDTGLIPVPPNHAFKRGEIVMTRTTRRLMKTSTNGRLTARHPCLILESSPTHVRVLQMTSHVDLTEEQCRVVGARLHHWLAREDPVHKDPFGRPGLVTSPPTDRAGYIWVGDRGEAVPVPQIRYLTGTIVEEPEIARLEGLIEQHRESSPCLIRLRRYLLFPIVHEPPIHFKSARLSPPRATRGHHTTSPAVSL